MKTAIKLVLRLATYGSAIASGFGIISLYWLGGTLLFAYLLSIYDESENAPSGDFGNLNDTEFIASDLNIKKRIGTRLVYA